MTREQWLAAHRAAFAARYRTTPCCCGGHVPQGCCAGCTARAMDRDLDRKHQIREVT